ncbi:MAG: SDR family NAD(P)-dependent oxidoreductase [Acidimicrobiia bacterium]|nr:SDR family NAD(P)-dependent oxidoreductase [Acidimicrobiia bacterium]
MELPQPLSRLVDATLEATVVASYTDVGITVRRHLSGWEDLEAIDATGRVVLITGATSGLGLETARQLARMGASVRLVGRDPAKTTAARADVESAAPGADVATYLADLANLTDVRRLVTEVLERESRLDVLVHNAGALIQERRESPDGHEVTFATMVLGPFALTEGLRPLLERTGGARVVTVSSGGMYTQRLVIDDLESQQGYRGSVAYARAKRAQVVLTELWAERDEGRGITFHAMHPGWAATPGVHDALPKFEKLLGSRLRSPAEGADTIVWLAVADEPTRSSGRFWLDRRPRGTHRVPATRESPEDRTRLWDLVTSVTEAGT